MTSTALVLSKFASMTDPGFTPAPPQNSETSDKSSSSSTASMESGLIIDSKGDSMVMQRAGEKRSDLTVAQRKEDDVDLADPPKGKRLKPDDGGEGSLALREAVNCLKCMQDIFEADRMVHKKWEEVFRESEKFEALATIRVEAILKEAYAFKDHLESEKRDLVGRFKGVISILEKDAVKN